MNKEQFIDSINTTYIDKGIPSYIEIEDFSTNQIKVNGEFTSDIDKWSLFEKNNKWYYVQTDNEKGYIDTLKEYPSLIEAIASINEYFEILIKAKEGNTEIDRVIRYIQDQTHYSKTQATTLACNLQKHKELFDEFTNYIRIRKFRKKDKTVVTIQGYTAQRLQAEYGLSPIDAYNYLLYLLEQPQVD